MPDRDSKRVRRERERGIVYPVRCADDATGGWTGIGCVETDCMKASTADVEKIWGEDLQKGGLRGWATFDFPTLLTVCLPATFATLSTS